MNALPAIGATVRLRTGHTGTVERIQTDGETLIRVASQTDDGLRLHDVPPDWIEEPGEPGTGSFLVGFVIGVVFGACAFGVAALSTGLMHMTRSLL